MVITDFLHDGRVAPSVNATLNKWSRIVLKALSSFATNSLMRLISTPSYPAALSFGIFFIVSRISEVEGSFMRLAHVWSGMFLAFRLYIRLHHLGDEFSSLAVFFSVSSCSFLLFRSGGSGYFFSSFSSGPGASSFFLRKR